MQTGAIYTDLSGLANLKARAAEKAPEATREAARQFEALFLQMMLKSMRTASAVLGEDRDTTYEEMFDQQISLEMTRGRGLGIAELLARQLGAGAHDTVVPTPSPYVPMPATVPIGAAHAAEGTTARGDWRPADARQFVRDLLPFAERAAAQLDLDPRTLLAQAALETGWGQRLIRDSRGVSGNNLFGIKADRRWDGERLAVMTLEYERGMPQRIRDEFRAYPSLEDGFADYVEFLQGNPRYDAATRGGLSPSAYAASLQDAGYATDPRYADKIDGIVNGRQLNDLVTELKSHGDVPIFL
jgi:flagellar protein FlgJ